MNQAQRTKHQDTDLPEDVVLSVRHVSKKFCRNLRRSMWYGIQDLGCNLLGLHQKSDSCEVPGSSFNTKPSTMNEAPSTASPSTSDQEPRTKNPELLSSPLSSLLHPPLPQVSGLIPQPSLLSLRKDEFWAFRDVGFDLRKGEILGLIGPNGSGKTTLLRVITGVFPPDEGSVCIRGRIGALLALGAGFHPHMTGMENIYLNGTILGMRREEIDEKIQSIVEFSEIRAFMDAPVSTYSSGMTVRLGFAIAVHMDPEILIIDEVLAVGDMSFQRKSLKRILELCHDGRAVVFVSHNMRSVQDLCTSTVFLKDGRIQASGRTRDVVREYIDASRKRLDPTRVAGTSGLAEENPDTGGVRVKRVQIVGEDGAPLGRLNMRQRFVVEITYERRDPEVKADFQVTLFTEDGTTVRCFNTKFNGVQVALYDEGVVQFIMEELPLMPGRFVLRGSVLDSTTGVPHDVWGVVDDRFVEFEVLADELSQGGMVAWDNLGIVSLPHVWSTRPTS